VAHSLKTPTTVADWEARGKFGVYDDQHPDEHKIGNFPKLLMFNDSPIGVIRIDIAEPVGWFRRVAIKESNQRQGHGSKLMRLAEQFAREHGVSRIQSDVDREAIPFYERFGFRLVRGGGTLMFKDL
jgi:GNAT superfamily N-acetyltransferase